MIQRSQPGATSRAAPGSPLPPTGTTTQRWSGGSVAVRPAGAPAGDPPAVRGDGDRPVDGVVGVVEKGPALAAATSPATSRATRAWRDAPCGSSTRQVATTVDPSGVTSYSARSSAPPGAGVRSVQVSSSPPPGSAVTGDAASSRGRAGPRSWSQNRTGVLSCRIAVTLASLRAARRVASSSAVTAPGRVADVQTTVPASRATTGPPSPPGRVPAATASPPPAGSVHSAGGGSSSVAAGYRSRGEEQQVTGRGERGVVLAGVAAGEAAGRPDTGGIDLPQRGAVAGAVGVGCGDGGDEPACRRATRPARRSGGGRRRRRGRGTASGSRAVTPPSLPDERGAPVRGRHGTSRTLPVVRRPSRSRCACAASASG